MSLILTQVNEQNQTEIKGSDPNRTVICNLIESNKKRIKLS